MSLVIRRWISLGLAALCLFASPDLRAAEEPAGDLTPVLPRSRKLFSNNNPDEPVQAGSEYISRSYGGYGNGGSQSLSADGKWLLMADNNGMMLWDLTEHRHGQEQPRTFGFRPNSFNMASAVLSPDGKIAAVALSPNSGNELDVRFFDTAAGKQIREIDNDQPIFGIAFSPDGRCLAVGTQQRIEIWNAEDGGEVHLFSATQNANYRLLTFSPDGKMIAALGMEPDTVHIWETASGKERASIHLGARSMLLGGGRQGAMMMRARMGAIMPMPAGEDTNSDSILALAFSADSRLLAVSKPDSAIHLWDLQANRELPPLTGFRGQATALVFSADGKELVAVDTEGMRLSWRMSAMHRNRTIRLKPLDDADFAELWDDLAELDAFRVYRARRHLVADPQRALPLLSRHLKPVPAGDSARIQKLIKDLSSGNSGTRRKAMSELRTKHGEAALGALMQSSGGGNAGMPGMPGMPARMMMMMGGQGNGSQAAMLLLQKLQTRYNTPERQRDVLATSILGEIGLPEALKILTQLSKGAAGVELTTASKTALDHLAAGAKESPRQATPEQLWSELANVDAARAFKAMRGLTAAPDQAVALLQKELKPIPVVPDKEIAELVDNLSSDDFKVREQATQSLAKIGEQALPAMKKALGGNIALEARKRLERLIEQAGSQTSVPLVRALRAIEVLERTGTTDAKNVLMTLSGGAPQAQLTREAKASLQRLARR